METYYKSVTPDVTAVILSAGKSERFGIPKAYLVFDESKSFIQNLLHEYHKAGIRHVVLVTSPALKVTMERQIQKEPPELYIEVVINPDPDKGRFSSIKQGLSAVDASHHAFIQNIDNPFTSSLLLRQMMSEIRNGIFVVPEYDGIEGHPVLLSKEIIQDVKNMKVDEANLKEILRNYPSAKVIAENSTILANINTPDEYRKYFHHVIAH